ncbi:MAG: amino acid permease [Bacteroidales bacterium]|nr:amino acid permease [Bacteroidales bacterium]
MINTENSKNGGVTGFAVWSMAFGCIIGWGAFMMPQSELIPNAGVSGAIIGTIFSALYAIVICMNYRTLAQKVPGEGGSYIYTKNIIGGDHAFLSVWALIMAYLSVLWSNMTAVSLFAKHLFGSVLQWGLLYNIAGYDVYLGEVLVTLIVLTVFGFIAGYRHKSAIIALTILSSTLFLSVVALFFGVIINADGNKIVRVALSESTISVFQVFSVTMIAPWLFVGFETITHIGSKINTPVKKTFIWTMAAILCGMIVYIMTILLSVTETTPKTDGIGMTVLYNAEKYMGKAGVWLVSIAVMSTLLTSVTGFYKATSRLFKIMADDGILPPKYAHTDSRGVPTKAVHLILALSVPVIFLGRTAIGWVVDIATLCVSVVYAYISVCAYKSTNRKREKIWAISGAIISVAMFMSMIIPNLMSETMLAKEAYIILTIWSLAGMFYYHYVFKHDKKGNFGKSTIMWLVMIFILFFSTIMWNDFSLQRSLEDSFDKQTIHSLIMRDGLIQMAVVVIALFCLFSLFTIMLKREHEIIEKFTESEEMRKETVTENVLLADFNSVLVTQKAEVETEKKKIEKQKNQIQSSINYAYTIQHALLTPENKINETFPDNFLLYQPRSVVSGDFYWMDTFGDNKVCIIGDCTGHGVPGGFMSMLGIANLNYIVGQELSPDMILNKLRTAIINSLRQQKALNRDGIDAIVYVFNEKKMTLSYAGANNPLIIIRGSEVKVLKADKMPVGIFIKERPFTKQVIKVKKGDCIYAFSDGYQDQLNYDTKQKFLSYNLRQKLLEIHHLDMKKQKEILVNIFEAWRGPKEKQVDDVLVFGVRI